MNIHNFFVIKGKKLCLLIKNISVLFAAKFALILFNRELYNERLWLVCEKLSEARDNGYHFYKYLKTQHPEIKSYYVITEDSVDLGKIKEYGNIIWANTFKHCVYFLAAEKSISSQAYGAHPFIFNVRELNFISKHLCNKKQKVVFLQHGITKDELAHVAFDYDKCNIDYFVCSANREYEFIKKLYHYPDKAIGCVGLSRFDKLYNASFESERIILVMPTWRLPLKRVKDGGPLSETEIERFKSSSFYKHYYELLSSQELRSKLKETNYKLVFYVHFQLQDYTCLFEEFNNDTIIIADRYHYDVQELLIKSRILMTDFSSVYFDFAYMNKAVIYYQFDREEFRLTQYAEGYFDYDMDGFGPCPLKYEEAKEEIFALLESDGAQPKKYETRVNDFFTIRDDKNCQRTFNDISKL